MTAEPESVEPVESHIAPSKVAALDGLSRIRRILRPVRSDEVKTRY